MENANLEIKDKNGKPYFTILDPWSGQFKAGKTIHLNKITLYIKHNLDLLNNYKIISSKENEDGSFDIIIQEIES